jgi:hypothetical protein
MKMSKIFALAIAASLACSLAGCARGGGIGLEAMVADHNCEEAGFTPGGRQCCCDAGLLSTPARLVLAAAKSPADLHL